MTYVFLGLGAGLSRQGSVGNGAVVSSPPPPPALSSISSMALVGNSYTPADPYAYIGNLNNSEQFYLFNMTSQTLEALSFDGTNISVVGSAYDGSSDGLGGFSNADGGAQIANNKVIWFNHVADDMLVYSFDGSVWSLEATQLNLFDLGGYPSGQMLEENKAVISVGNTAGTDDVIQLVEYDGSSTLSKVGNPITITGNYEMPVVMSATRIAVVRTNINTVQAYDWDGTNFTAVGNALSIGATAGRVCCASIGENELIVWVGNVLSAIEFDGTNWTQKATLSIGASSWPRTIAKISDTRFAAHYYGSGGNIKVIDITRT